VRKNAKTAEFPAIPPPATTTSALVLLTCIFCLFSAVKIIRNRFAPYII